MMDGLPEIGYPPAFGCMYAGSSDSRQAHRLMSADALPTPIDRSARCVRAQEAFPPCELLSSSRCGRENDALSCFSSRLSFLAVLPRFKSSKPLRNNAQLLQSRSVANVSYQIKSRIRSKTPKCLSSLAEGGDAGRLKGP